MKIVKTKSAAVLAAASLCVMSTAGANPSAPATEPTANAPALTASFPTPGGVLPGLSRGPGATVLLNGKPYRGVGVNYFDCFLRTLRKNSDTSYEAGFRVLAEYHIPFVRFCATGFYPKEMKLYQENREAYFRLMDGVVRCAEKNGVGLIPSLFWYNTCVPDMMGEHLDQWGNPDSKTVAFMRQYTHEVVSRYRSSPAIWAWEYMNEFDSYCDLPNAATFLPAVTVPRHSHQLGTARGAHPRGLPEIQELHRCRQGICPGGAARRSAPAHRQRLQHVGSTQQSLASL